VGLKTYLLTTPEIALVDEKKNGNRRKRTHKGKQRAEKNLE
jgi:hypothetical protein